MSLKSLSDKALILETEKGVREEREVLTRLLHLFHEIQRRRLFSSMGYKSLFDCLNKHFGYSEDETYRRISAMKLLVDIPQIEEKINQGELTLTHLKIAQSHFYQEMKVQSKEVSLSDKLALIEQIAKKPVREATRIALSLSSASEVVQPDQVKVISLDRIELKFSASQELQNKIDQLKGMLAHSNPGISLGELFDKLCDLGLTEWNLAKVGARRKYRINESELGAHKKTCVKYSQAKVLRAVYERANNKCQSCGSHYALEVDHVLPRAKGGSSMPENLRVLCRSCNQRAAIKEFGQHRMDPYIN